jgi:hypothetical protein
MIINKRPKKVLDREIKITRLLKKKVIWAWSLEPKRGINNEEGD